MIGLNGDHDGACVACLTPTDTAFAFVGIAEFAAAGLVRLGVPAAEAPEVVSAAMGCDPGMARPGTQTVLTRVCAACAERAGFPRPGLLVTNGDVPCFYEEGRA